MRRTRLTGKAQQQLWPEWRHHAFLTNLDGTAVDVDRHHRAHAVVELNIRDLKEGAGMEHCPSGVFFANAAWLACAVWAHNLMRWTLRLGGMRPDELVVTRTIRRQLIHLPGRLVNLSGTPRPGCPRTGHGGTASPAPSTPCAPSPPSRSEHRTADWQHRSSTQRADTNDHRPDLSPHAPRHPITTAETAPSPADQPIKSVDPG